MPSHDEPPSVRETRQAVREWLADAWDPSLTVREWWARLADSGWAFPHWPAEWSGRGLGYVEAAAVVDELAAAGVLGPPEGAGVVDGRPTVLLAYGTEEQKRRWLPALARGEEAWCQFFSEPGAGSDLASVQTRAVRDGDQWVVNGAEGLELGHADADRGLLVARTDPDQPKHRGISLLHHRGPPAGLDIRPIRQMNGEATSTRPSSPTPPWPTGPGRRAQQRLRVALATLTNERTTFAGGGHHAGYRASPGERAGMLDLTVGRGRGRPSPTPTGGANTPRSAPPMPADRPGQGVRPGSTTRCSASAWPTSTPSPRRPGSPPCGPRPPPRPAGHRGPRARSAT